MVNLAMARKIETATALDVRRVGKPTNDANVFELTEYIDGVDYCDAQTERWIWSIGRDLVTGKFLAAVDGRFYGHPDFECLWLR